jgi:proton-dependent oligopeptide transporter, POT family
MSDVLTQPAAAAAPANVAQGHPRGLYTLFFTEMWERFSYYGMRALLVLFMTDAIKGGMGLTDKTATSIYGLYTAAVYLMSLPGGWLGDRLFGAQKAVWYGGIIIALGHFTLAIPRVESFYLGLVLVVIGSGVLKPNMSAMVGDLYPEGGARRDAGFSIFYMGVNLGAAIGPLVCSSLAEGLNWHYGFVAAGVGMVLGLVQFRASRRLLGTAGLQRGNEKPLSLFERTGLFGAIALLVVVIGLCMSGALRIDPVPLIGYTSYVIAGIAVLYFLYLFLLCGLDRVEKWRVAVILVLFLSSALFWCGFEQTGSSFNLFAERYTDRVVTWAQHQHTVPAGWFQSLGAVFIVIFAPVFAGLWVRLARRNLDPSFPVKFGLGLVLLAAGFGVMAIGATFITGGGKAGPMWLTLTYLLHTFGELCLSPVGLSSVTKLAPRRLVGQLMGVWFLATSLGNLLAGIMAGQFDDKNLAGWAPLYLRMAILPTITGVILIFLAKPIMRRAGGIK